MKGLEHKRQVALSSMFIGAMVVLCGILGLLQYRWIGEVSVAARERLRGALEAALDRISHDFDSEIAAACQAIAPDNPSRDELQLEADIAARFARWKRSGRQSAMFSRIAIVSPDKPWILRSLDFEKGVFETAEWPSEWLMYQRRFGFRNQPDPARGGPPGPPFENDSMSVEFPLFPMPGREITPGPPGRPENGRPESDRMMLLRLNETYTRDVSIPEILQRQLGATLSDYQIAVLTRSASPAVIYQSSPMDALGMSREATASTTLLGSPVGQIFRRGSPPGGRGRGRGGPGRGQNDMGRWTMYVSYRAGSLETVVAQLRWRNLAAAAGVLLLLILSAAALVRFTRRAQKLAELQMGFVAGVSHELRTPLAVLHSAGYNLTGNMAGNPEQVRRYGRLIQEESGRLTQLVERVLQFAGAEAGRLVQGAEPLSVDTLIDSALTASKGLIPESCKVELKVDAGLPLIMADALSLKQALANLISNAVKYGIGKEGWIGVRASRAAGAGNAVEIRVTDRGPGIPADEQKRVFDAFFRGRRAIQDQIHGAGLGLNLAKRIVEAHGGVMTVRSEPGAGAEFIVRIPAAPDGGAA